jgi:hypothetical protein
MTFLFLVVVCWTYWLAWGDEVKTEVKWRYLRHQSRRKARATH